MLIGREYTVDYTTQNLPNLSGSDLIQIRLSRDGGDTWSIIISSQINTGTFDWEVSGPITVMAQFEISAIDNLSGLRDPDRSFTGDLFSITGAAAQIKSKARFSYKF